MLFKDADNIFAPLMMVFIGALKRTLVAGKTVHQTESTDTSFDPPQFALDSTFKALYFYCGYCVSDVFQDLFLSSNVITIPGGSFLTSGKRSCVLPICKYTFCSCKNLFVIKTGRLVQCIISTLLNKRAAKVFIHKTTANGCFVTN